MSDATHRRGGRIAVAGGVGLALAAACSDVPTDPAEPFSMSVSLPFPSVVVGEQMTNAAGDPTPVQVTVYNGAGEVIADAPVTFRLIDEAPGASVDADGFITGVELASGELAEDVRLVVDAGGLQSAPLVFDVVPRPDSLDLPDTEIAPAEYNVLTGPRDTSEALVARVLHLPGGDAEAVGVPSWRVRYALSVNNQPATSDSTPLFWFVDVGGTGRATAIDTTDDQGRASRKLRINGDSIGPLAAIEQVVVVITAEGRDTLVAKPDTIIVPIRRRQTGS